MRYRIRHTTQYDYAQPVSLCHNESRLTPRSLAWQSVTNATLNVSPNPVGLSWRKDYFGNPVTAFSVQERHSRLAVTAESVVDTLPRPSLSSSANKMRWQDVELLIQSSPLLRLYQLNSPFAKRHISLAEFAKQFFTEGRPLVESVSALNQHIYQAFSYEPGYTNIATPVLDVLASKRGVCQDFAHLMISSLRSIGLAARYVSGYLETVAPEGQPRLVGADASHAWVAVLIPNWGWLEFDPTNGSLPAQQHIVAGWGRDYSDVTPLKGIMSGGGSHQLSVSVDVERLHTSMISGS